MANVVFPITVGEFYFDLTGYTYYGYDSGPNAFYGDIGSSVFVGVDGKEYIVHATRWAAESPNNRVYLRLDNPTISASDGWQSYRNVFTSYTVGSTTLSSSAIVNGFTVDGGVGFYWNVVSNPFGAVGGTTNISLNGVFSGAYGLEIYNSSGTPVVTITDRLVRYVSYHTGTLSGNQTTSISVPGVTNDGTWGFNSEGGDGTYVKATFGATGYINLQNLGSLSRVYNIQVFRV